LAFIGWEGAKKPEYFWKLNFSALGLDKDLGFSRGVLKPIVLHHKDDDNDNDNNASTTTTSTTATTTTSNISALELDIELNFSRRPQVYSASS